MISRSDAALIDVAWPPPEPCPLWVLALLERTIEQACAGHRVSPDALRETLSKTPRLVAAREEIARAMFAAYPKKGVLSRAWGVKYEALRRWIGRDDVAPPKRRCA